MPIPVRANGSRVLAAALVCALLQFLPCVLRGEEGWTESQPEQTDAYKKELESLKAEVQKLRTENAQLRKENQELRRLLPQPATDTPATTSQTSTPAKESASSATTQVDKETGYWMTNSSHKRHNRNCRYYKNSSGHFCGPNDGVPCKICGG